MKKYFIIMLILWGGASYAGPGANVSMNFESALHDYVHFSYIDSKCFYSGGSEGSRPERFVGTFAETGTTSAYVEANNNASNCLRALGFFRYDTIDREGYVAQVQIQCYASQSPKCMWRVLNQPSSDASYTLTAQGTTLIVKQREISGPHEEE